MIKVIEKQNMEMRLNWQMFTGAISEGIIDDIVAQVDKIEQAKTFNDADKRLEVVAFLGLMTKES